MVCEEAHSQSFPTVYLSIEIHVSKCVNWRLFISLMNQCHLDTFTASQIVTEPSGTCHRRRPERIDHCQLRVGQKLSKYIKYIKSNISKMYLYSMYRESN